MKKSITTAALSLTLLSSALLPSITVHAKEPDQIGVQKENSSKPEFDYSVTENNLTGVNTIKLNYKGDEETASYNKNTGEIIMNDQVVAIINKTKTSLTDDEIVNNNLIQPLAVAGAKYYSIGTPGSGTYKWLYDDDGTISIIPATASVITCAAVLVSLFSESKPAKNAAQIVAAAGSLLAIVTSTKTTFGWNYNHYQDSKNSKYYEDTLGIYYPTTIKAENLKIMITHYYGFN